MPIFLLGRISSELGKLPRFLAYYLFVLCSYDVVAVLRKRVTCLFYRKTKKKRMRR